MNSFAAQRYLSHWLHAVNEHSLHSPFLFDFYKEVIKPAKKPSLQIEEIRNGLLQNTKIIEQADFGAGSKVLKNSTRSIRSIAKTALSTPAQGALLRDLLRFLQSKNILEIGTSLGISTLYLAEANPASAVTTIEGAPALARFAKELFEQVHPSRITVMTGKAEDCLESLLASSDPFDAIFLDAHHTEMATLQYFQWIKKYATEDTWLILDDIHWSHGMEKAWQRIIKDEAVSLSLDLYSLGIVSFSSLYSKEHFILQRHLSELL